MMQEEFAGVVVRVVTELVEVSSRCGGGWARRQASCRVYRDINGLFESMLAEAFQE